MQRLLPILLTGLALAGCGGSADVADPGSQVARTDPAAAPEPAAPAEPAAAPAADVSIIAQEFAYGATADRNFVGYFATPDQIIEPLPGVVLVHEWWGLNDSIRGLARRLATEGYAVLAVDLYDRATGADTATAQALMSVVMTNRAAAIDNISQAIDYLRAYALAPRVAVLGYGLGGGLGLETAIAAPEKIDAVVSFYGRLVYDTESLAAVRAPLLGFYGEQDDSIPVREVQTFRATLQDLGKDAEILIQLGAGNGFADPDRPTFNAAVADESWGEMLRFLERTIHRTAR